MFFYLFLLPQILLVRAFAKLFAFRRCLAEKWVDFYFSPQHLAENFPIICFLAVRSGGKLALVSSFAPYCCLCNAHALSITFKNNIACLVCGSVIPCSLIHEAATKQCTDCSRRKRGKFVVRGASVSPNRTKCDEIGNNRSHSTYWDFVEPYSQTNEVNLSAHFSFLAKARYVIDIFATWIWRKLL
jgi:hypothetical protein